MSNAELQCGVRASPCHSAFRIPHSALGTGTSHGTQREERALRRAVAPPEDPGPEREEREEGLQDLVAAQHDHARLRRAHAGGAQREQVHPGVHHREHGGPQARGVRGDAAVPRALGQGLGTGTRGRRSGRRRGAEGVAMEARAIQRTVRQSARKMRLVIDQIRGRAVPEAYAILRFSKKLAAKQIHKVLKSAVANAEQQARRQNAAFDADRLRVRYAVVNEGPTLKRFTAAAMGRATPILKRTSHVEIHVAGEDAPVAPPVRAGTAEAKAEPPAKRKRAASKPAAKRKRPKAAAARSK